MVEKRCCIDDLVLDIDVDLSMYAFVDASKLLDWYKHEIAHKDVLLSEYSYLEINIENYHVARMLAELAEIDIKINNALDDDEWYLVCSWFDRKIQRIKRVHVIGA